MKCEIINGEIYINDHYFPATPRLKLAVCILNGDAPRPTRMQLISAINAISDQLEEIDNEIDLVMRECRPDRYYNLLSRAESLDRALVKLSRMLSKSLSEYARDPRL